MKRKQKKLSLKKLKIATVSQIHLLKGGMTVTCGETNITGETCVDTFVVCETDECASAGSCECTTHAPSKTK
ncbi:hypothetical protein [uncultured Kordia sp.]|uniref:hypothetical protein n=1 Tax=uncultured Kordia sp. TaxID=507699 RepID=UPI00260DADAB|nr:hypothetical protein [uncultured Kordia sp.]